MEASVRNSSQKRKHNISSNEVTSHKSSADASMLFGIKSKLPSQLEDLSVEKIQDIVAEADAAGKTNLSDRLIPMYTLVEELHYIRHGDHVVAVELQKAQKAVVQYRT